MTPVPAEELLRIEGLYGKRDTPDGAEKHVFTGRFTDATPADVGGAGTYAHYGSPLGSTSAYVERFRGDDDIEAVMTIRRQAMSDLVSHVLAWLASELGREEGFEQLSEFVDRDLRRDMVNLALLAWAAEAAGESDDVLEAVFRYGQYLRERGYFSPRDVPALARVVLSDESESLLKHLRRLLARKLGVADEQPVPAALDFLSDEETVAASWYRYVATTETYRERLKRWEEEKAADPSVDPPMVEDVAEDVLEDALSALIEFDVSDSLEVELHCGAEPYETNGQWDPDTGTVGWSSQLRENPALPAISFALWSAPRREAQIRHFGKVILAGEELAKYVLWYQGLSGEESRQWDRFLAGLTPSDHLRAAVEAFRFAGDAPADPEEPEEAPPSRADFARELILDGLAASGDEEG